MATKQTRDIYRGVAKIMNVTLTASEDWREWERRDLPERDLGNAFKINYDVSEGTDGQGARHEITIEISHRELKGKMLEYYKREDGQQPSQIDVAVRSLVQQGILPKGATEKDLFAATDDALCGKEVTIRAYEELGQDGATWWPRCAFASKVVRLTGADKSARLAAFLAGTPAPKPAASVATAAAPQMPSAPAEEEVLPF